MELCSECGVAPGSYPVVEEFGIVNDHGTVTGRITDTKKGGRMAGRSTYNAKIDGKWYKISNGGSFPYWIDDHEYHDTAHVFELDGFGRLTGNARAVEDGHTSYYCAGCLPSGSFHLILQSPPPAS